MKLLENRTFMWLLALVVVVTLGAHVLPAPRTIDDAFITFRYSRNIVSGEGFVYNPGVRTLGTTTPLYTLLMAVISTITGGQDFPWYALTANALTAAGSAVFLSLILYRVTGNRWWSALIGLLWGLSPTSVTFSVGGMETSVNILWLVGTVYWFITDRPVWLGIFAGLGFLTRIDSLIWMGPLLLYQWGDHWLQHRADSPLARIPWRTWLTAVLVTLPWLLFAWAYFGSPVPNSLSAKSVAYTLPEGAALATFVRAYVVPFSESQLLGSGGVMIASLFYLVLMIRGLVYIVKKFPRLLPFALYPWLYLIVFVVVNPLIFRWYVAPPLPVLILTLMIGVWAIVRDLSEATKLRPLAPVVFGVVSVLWLSTSISGWQLQPDHGPQRPAPEMAWHQIELYYEEIGTQLRDELGVTPETRVASADIGAIGYFSGATIIDTVGLVTPELSAYYPVDASLVVVGQNYAIPPQLIYDTVPEYLVTMEAFVRQGLETEREFKDRFQLITVILTDFYGTGMRLYRAVA